MDEELDMSQQQVREVNIFVDIADREKCTANPTSPGIEQYSPLFASGKTIDGKPMKDWPALGIWMSLKNKVNSTQSSPRWRSSTPSTAGASAA